MVDSAPGKGTRVVVTLPLHEPAAATAAPRPVGSILFGHFADA
jgi:hypothetical protein